MRSSNRPRLAPAPSLHSALSKTSATQIHAKSTATSRCDLGDDFHRLLQQVFFQELHRRVELKILVGLLAEAVSFIFANQEPHWRALFFQRRGDLFAFTNRNARIIFARHHHHWLLDFFDVVHRRDLFQELVHLWVAFV